MIGRARQTGIVDYYCGFPRCSHITTDENKARAHERLTHHRCECGKWTLNVGQHQAQARRFGHDHASSSACASAATPLLAILLDSVREAKALA